MPAPQMTTSADLLMNQPAVNRWAARTAIVVRAFGFVQGCAPNTAVTGSPAHLGKNRSPLWCGRLARKMSWKELGRF